VLRQPIETTALIGNL